MDIAAPREVELRDQVMGIMKSRVSPTSLFIFELPMGNSRADLAIINPNLFIGIEIKSGRDTLSRLDTQIPDYELYFDQCWIVADKKHWKNINNVIPRHWGVIASISNPDTSGNLAIVYRPAEPNPMDPEERALRIADHLHVSEIDLAFKLQGKKVPAKATKHRKIRALNKNNIRGIVYKAFVERKVNRLEE